MTRVTDGVMAPAIALRQGGVFTRPQALAEGFSYWQIRARVQSRDWALLPGRGITAMPERIDGRAVAWSAHLTVPTAILSHTTAGAVLGFPMATDRSVAHVITSKHQVPNGLIGHRLGLAPGEKLYYAMLPVTSRARTALDCLGMLDWPECLRLWAWVSSRGILSVGDLARAVRERFGQSGTATLLRLLAWARDGALSEAERRMHRLLRLAGIGGWTANIKISDGTGAVIAIADVCFPVHRLVIEIDGYAVHSGREAFVNDRRRQNALVNAGYRVLRVTWDDLVSRPRELVAEVLVALGR